MSKLPENAQVSQFISKDQNSLTDSQVEILTALENLNKEAPVIAKKLENNLRDFQAYANELFASQIPEDLMDRKDELLGIFNRTLVERTATLADELSATAQKKESMLFNGLLVSYAVKILEGILEFEKKIESVFPGSSEKIIKAASNALTALVATHFPTIAMAMKASGIMEKAESFLKIDNLEKTVKNLKTKIATIEQDQKLANIYKNGMEIGQIAEITSIPTQSIAKLDLDASSLKSIKSNLTPESNAASFLQEASKAVEIMPNNEKNLVDKLTAIKEAIHSSINNGGLSLDQSKKITQAIDNRFEEVKKNLQPILKSGASFFEKVEVQQKTASMIVKVTKDALDELNKDPNKTRLNEAIIQNVAQIVKETLQGNIMEVMKQAAKSPSTARELGLNNAIKVNLDKLASQQKSEAIIKR